MYEITDRQWTLVRESCPWAAEIVSPRPRYLCAVEEARSDGLYFLDGRTGKRPPSLPSGAWALVRAGNPVPNGVRAVEVAQPRRVFAQMTQIIRRDLGRPVWASHGIATVAVGADVDPSAVLGPHAVVGPGCRIGPDCEVMANAVLVGGVALGARVRVQPGAVLGSDGFGYALDPDEPPVAIAHLGGVTVGADCDIGPGTIVCGGTLRPTEIGDETLVEGGCYIGHNARIGRNCLIMTQSVIGGSVVVGDGVEVMPSATVRGKVSIGDKAVIGLGGTVMSPVDDGETLMGDVAMPIRTRLRRQAALDRLIAGDGTPN